MRHVNKPHGPVVPRSSRVRSIALHAQVPLAQQGELRERLRQERRCAPVFLESAVAQGHYHVYCKNVLWPLFHYVMETEGPHESVVDAKAWDVYRAANEAFAAEVLRQYEPGDLGTIPMRRGQKAGQGDWIDMHVYVGPVAGRGPSSPRFDGQCGSTTTT